MRKLRVAAKAENRLHRDDARRYFSDFAEESLLQIEEVLQRADLQDHNVVQQVQWSQALLYENRLQLLGDLDVDDLRRLVGENKFGDDRVDHHKRLTVSGNFHRPTRR